MTSREPHLVPEGIESCPACGAMNPLDEFNRNRAESGGPYCKPCHNATGAAIEGTAARGNHLSGATGCPPRTRRMIEEQGGLCACAASARPSTSTTIT